MPPAVTYPGRRARGALRIFSGAASAGFTGVAAWLLAGGHDAEAVALIWVAALAGMPVVAIGRDARARQGGRGGRHGR